MLSFHFAYFVNVNIDCMHCLATKNTKIPQIFKNTRIVLPWKQNCEFKIKELNISEDWFVYAVLLKHY